MLKKQNFWTTALQMKVKTLISNKMKANESRMASLKSEIDQHRVDNVSKEAKIKELTKMEANLKSLHSQTEDNVTKQMDLLKNELANEK